MNLCQYKDIFGIPRTGVHSIRVFDFAIVDIILTILFAYFVYQTLNLYNLRFITILGILIVLGIFLHWLFCVNTKLNTLLNTLLNILLRRLLIS